MQMGLLCAVVFKLRGLFMVPLVVLFVASAYWEWEHDFGVWSVGLTVFLSGAALRFWAQLHLKYRTHRKHDLVVTGPYQYIRNPIYVGNMLILSGLAILCELLWAVPIALSWSGLVYALAVRFEEIRLMKRHGDAYLRYREAVPGWLPFRRRFRSQTRRGTGNWIASLAAEWHCVALLAIPVAKELLVDCGLF